MFTLQPKGKTPGSMVFHIKDEELWFVSGGRAACIEFDEEGNLKLWKSPEPPDNPNDPLGTIEGVSVRIKEIILEQI